jgi:prephenate dehydratase
VFSTANTPGSLYEALKILAERNINMVKLESRPIPGKPWQEMFYVDVDIPRDPEAFEPALEALKQATQELRLLGLYTV